MEKIEREVRAYGLEVSRALLDVLEGKAPYRRFARLVEIGMEEGDHTALMERVKATRERITPPAAAMI